MKKNIIISVVVATYNSEKTVRHTLESLLHQTYDNYEVLVVDGCSSDGTLDIVREYEPRFEGRLRCVSEPDKGLYDAMNKGYRLVQGDIVGLLNSDDFYSSEEVLATIARAFQSEDVDAVYADVHYVKATDIRQMTRYYSSRVFRRGLMRLGFMPAHPSFYCRRSIVLEYGMFNLQYKVAADFDQMVRLIYKQRIRTRYIPMDVVTMRAGGVSNANIASRMTIMNEHSVILRQNGVRSCRLLLSLRYIYKIGEVIAGSLKKCPALPEWIK